MSTLPLTGSAPNPVYEEAKAHPDRVFRFRFVDLPHGQLDVLILDKNGNPLTDSEGNPTGLTTRLSFNALKFSGRLR